MKFHFSINRNALKAVLMCAAKDDIRYYLNGVLIELQAKRVILCATDGHRLALYRHADCSVAQEADGTKTPSTQWLQIIMPYDMCKSLTAGKALLSEFTCEYDSESCTIRALNLANMQWLECKAVDGKFPDYRRVIPTGKLSGMVSQFQGRYLADFDKMAEILGGSTSCAYISHNGAVTPEGKRADGAARVILSSEPHNFIGVVIPLAVTHADDIGCAAEEWATRAWKEPAPGTYPEGLQAHPLA